MKLLSEDMKVEMGTSLSPTLYVDERANQIFFLIGPELYFESVTSPT